MPEPLLPVFVYGTLRPGRRNWPVVADRVDRHRPARLPGHRLYQLDFPMVVDARDAAAPGVVGDLLWMTPDRYRETLAALDRFEDHHVEDPSLSLYVRAERPVRLAGSSSTVAAVAAPMVEAWVYLAGPSHVSRLKPDHELTSGEYLG